VDVVADRPDHLEGLDLVGALDRPGFHHRRHAVGPVDLALIEVLDQVDVDEVDPERLIPDARLLEVVEERVHELGYLLVGSGTDRALDPHIGVADVLLGNPGAVLFEMEADVALFVDDRLLARRKHNITEAWLQPVPPRSES
jgi:hypothetical protein